MTYRIYVDESIHTKDGFIIAAIVATTNSIEDDISKALTSAGLQPGVDEYKSRNPKANNPAAQKLRADLHAVLFQHHCYIGLVICDITERTKIAEYALKLIAQMVACGRFSNQSVIINFDDGLLTSTPENFLKSQFPLENISIAPNSDSRKVYGLQLADMVAHMAATILRCDLGSLKKATPAGPNSGYDPDTMIELEFELWAGMRYNLASSEPVVLFENGEPTLFAEYDPFGLFISDACRVKVAAFERFGSVYLGCIH